jgi:hypothetical protein
MIFILNSTDKEYSQETVAHACNPSYSEERDLEDCGLKPAWANSSGDPISKKSNTKTRLEEWLKW